jgi:hypothetical protein
LAQRSKVFRYVGKSILNKMTKDMKDKKAILSTLWIFVTANYIICDVFSNMDPAFLNELLDNKELLGLPVDQKFLLLSAIFMEIPIAMILLSRVLKYRVNRWANIIAGTIMTLAQTSSLFVGPPTLHYTFYSIIEISCTLFIIGYSWKWVNPIGNS